MITDRGRSYEAHSLARSSSRDAQPVSRKTLSDLLEKKKGLAREFGEDLKILF
jgi:hypothetical protein